MQIEYRYFTTDVASHHHRALMYNALRCGRCNQWYLTDEPTVTPWILARMNPRLKYQDELPQEQCRCDKIPATAGS